MSDPIIPTGSSASPRRSGRGTRPPVPRVPDFARADATWLQPKDIAFLLETTGHYDGDDVLITEGVSPAIEALLDRDEIYAKVAGAEGGWLDISAHLYFHVLLRRRLPRPKTYLQRRVIRYLANLLSLFVRTHRIYRVQPGEAESFEYLVDLLAEAAESERERQFLVHAHLGNYALYLVGIGRGWIEHRFHTNRSALGVGYYRDMGRRAYQQAAGHRLARDLELTPVFEYLAAKFDGYARALQRLRPA